MNIKLKKYLTALFLIGIITSTLSAQTKKAKPINLGSYKNEGYYGNLYQLKKNEGYDFLGKLPIFVGNLLSLTEENHESQDLLFVYIVPKYFYRASKNWHLPYGNTGKQGNMLFSNIATLIDAPFDKLTIGNGNAYLSTGAGMFLISTTPDKLSVLSLIGKAQFSKNFQLITENFHFLTTFDNPEIVGSIRSQFSWNKFSLSAVVGYNLYDTRKLGSIQNFELTSLRSQHFFTVTYPSVFLYIEGKINLF